MFFEMKLIKEAITNDPDKSASLSISVKELTKKYGQVYALNNEH